MGKPNPIRKACIYLDQFVVSGMVEPQQEIWVRVREQLLELHRAGKIFCPLSHEHYFETSAKYYESAREHDAFFSRLSDGYCFKHEADITPQLISSRIRRYPVTLNTYMLAGVASAFSSKENYEGIGQSNRDFREHMGNAVSGLNELRHATNEQKIDVGVRAALLSATHKIPVRKFLDRLKELQHNGYFLNKFDNFGTLSIPNWIDYIIHRLVTKHRFGRSETVKLISELEKYGFGNIPSLDVKFRLMSLMSVYSKVEEPGDHIDLMRLSTGLPVSDYLFTDKKRKNEILESGLDRKYGTKVYCGTAEDLEKFLTDTDILR